LVFLQKQIGAKDNGKNISHNWREPSGLRLQPDWWYPVGAENESFNKWINGG